MRKGTIIMIVIIASILLIAAAGCYDPGGPVPEGKHPRADRAWNMEEVDAAVSMEMEKIYSPAPGDNGTPPGECDYIHFLRFRPRGGSGEPAEADAILVLMPGFLGGANSLEYVSRQLVYMALTQKGTHMEVWAMDRRANNLEDLAGLNAAEEAHDTQVAIDYYYKGAEIDGRVFEGFLGNEDVPFLSEFGLKLAMEDVYKVITTMVPDPEVRRQKVFVGGHSLGGPLAAFFAGWDFDGDPATLEDAGYMNCAGLVGLDTRLKTTLSTSGLSLSSFFGVPDITDASVYAEIVGGIRSGSLSRIVPLPMIYPEYLALLEPLAMEAAWHPDEESTFLDRMPYSENVDSVFKVLHSRSIDQYLVHVPSVRDFRFTNEAQLGIIMDDNFQPVTALQVSCGFLSGGAVVEKDFPLPQYLAQIPELSRIFSSLLNMDGQFIANDAGPSYFNLGTGPLYSWANFDEIGDSADPDYKDADGVLTYTTMEEEVSDVQDVARFLYYGPTNAMEWYFTLRIMVDMEAAVSDFGPACGLPFLHGNKIGDLPQVEFVAEKGPFHAVDSDVETIRGYNHLDVCVAAADRPTRRENEVIKPLIDFMLGNTGDKAAD
jgi:hypothetical protein